MLAPRAHLAAAELAAALPLWSLLAADWTPQELAAHEGRLLRRAVPWISSGLLPPARRAGEDAAAYVAQLDGAALRLAGSPRARDARRIGRQIRRFATHPRVARILASPELRQRGALASAQWPALASAALELEAREPRSLPHGPGTAGATPSTPDWDAVDKAAKAEREAREKATRAEFSAMLRNAATAYATAVAAFPALGVAAPAVAAALGLGATFVAGAIQLSRYFPGEDLNSQAHRERAASELRYWFDLGVPPLVFDPKIFSAAGYADTLAKTRAWYERQPADVQGAYRDLGARLKRIGSQSAVANAGANRLAIGHSGSGPIWGPAFVDDPAATTVAKRIVGALADVYASDMAARGWQIPEAKARDLATKAYHDVLLTKSIPIEERHGLALARAIQTYVGVAQREGRSPLGGLVAQPEQPSTGGAAAAAVAGLGLAALLFL